MNEDMNKRLEEIRVLYKDESFVFDFDEGVTHEFVGDLLSEIDRLKKDNDELISAINEKNLGKYRIADNQISKLEAKNKNLREQLKFTKQNADSCITLDNKIIQSLEAKLKEAEKGLVKLLADDGVDGILQAEEVLKSIRA